MNGKYEKQIRNILTILLTIAILAVLKITSSISITVLLALFLFLLFTPIVNALDNGKVPGFISILLVIILLLVIVLATLAFVFYAVDTLVHIIPTYSNRLEYVELSIVNLMRRFIELPEDFSLFGSINIDWVGVLMPVLRSVSSSTVSIVSDAFVVIIMALFLLLERKTVLPKLESIVDYKKRDMVGTILNRINHQVSKYLTIKMIVSAATGLCFYGICLYVKMDGALIWGVLTFILNFIPTFGSIIITALTIFISIIQFLPDWEPILIVAIGTISTQMIIGNIIDPRLQGNKLNLSPFAILVSLSLFGYIFGIVGMFLAVPLLSILQIIFINIDSTKPLAYILSSGRSIKKEIKTKEGEKDEQMSFDFIMPDKN